MTGAIDVHTHFVPERLPALPAGLTEPSWPSSTPGKDACHCNIMVKGELYRAVTHQCWHGAQRIADMDAMGVAHQVLSPMPELLSYWMPAPIAKILHRDLNEQMAKLAQDHPCRFSTLAAVPLQDIDLAIAELEHAATVLQMQGVEIGSNVNGRPIGAVEFKPFFAAAERLEMAVFVHAIRPAGVDRLIGPAVLQQALGFPTEIGLAATSVLCTNLIQEFPRLRIAFSHGGGSLAMLLPRLQHAWSKFPQLKSGMPQSPVEQARKLYYDALVYDRETLLFLVERFGADALMVGTDYPFAIMETEPLQRLGEAGFTGQIYEQLRGINAGRFLQRR